VLAASTPASLVGDELSLSEPEILDNSTSAVNHNNQYITSSRQALSTNDIDQEATVCSLPEYRTCTVHELDPYQSLLMLAFARINDTFGADFYELWL